ncbi:MAG: glycosyltransferase family 39 protein [Thermoanaerobaculia bacterium]
MTRTRWVLLFALVLFGWNVWGYDLWAPNEPFFAEGAREMIVDGQWIVPHLNGEVNTHKPPLFFWSIAIFSLPFGAVTSLTARLPSVLAAIGTVLLIVRFERRFSGNRTAVLAAAMLTVNYFFWDKARSAQIDSLLCLLILIAVSAFAAYRGGEWNGRSAGLVFWSAAALAVLAKGPVGLLVPLGIVLLTLAWDRQLRSWWGFAPVAGPLAFAAILGLWITAATLWLDGYSVWGALREHFVDRAIHGMHHAQPVWYYLRVLPYALLPWTFLLPGGLWLAWRERDRPDNRLLLIWVVFVVLFFTVSTEKRDVYILPAMPAFAMIFARLVAAVLGWRSEGSRRRPGQRWVTVPQGVVGTVYLLAAVVALWMANRLDDDLLAPAAAIAAVLAIGGARLLVSAIRGAVWPAVAWTGATIAAALLTGSTWILPVLNPAKSGRELAVTVREATAEFRATGRRVVGFDLVNVTWPVNLYSDGVYLDLIDAREEPIEAGEELLRRLAVDDPVYVLANLETQPSLLDHLQGRMSVAYSTRLSRKDLQLLYFEPSHGLKRVGSGLPATRVRPGRDENTDPSSP